MPTTLHTRAGLLFQPVITMRKHQKRIIKVLLQNFFSSTGSRGCVVEVPCGFGKSAIALAAAGLLGCPFAILTPSTEIAQQWIWQLVQLFRQENGGALKPKDIGMIAGKASVQKDGFKWTSLEGDWCNKELVRKDEAVLLVPCQVAADLPILDKYFEWAQRHLLLARPACDDGVILQIQRGQYTLSAEGLSGAATSIKLNGTVLASIADGEKFEVFTSPFDEARARAGFLQQVCTEPSDLAQCRILVASVASLSKGSTYVHRLTQMEAVRGRFPLSILDEAQHYADKAVAGTYVSAVRLVSAPQSCRWGLTAALLRQDKHARDIIRDFGPVMARVEYAENKEAVNLCLDKITVPVQVTDHIRALWGNNTDIEVLRFQHAVTPRKLLASMLMLAQATSCGAQGLVFFSRRAVQEVFVEYMPAENVYKLHGTASTDELDVAHRSLIRQKISEYDHRDPTAKPILVLTTNCWETGVDLPKVRFTLFVNETCEGRCHIVQACGRATRQDPDNPDKTALLCMLPGGETREAEFADALMQQLRESYGVDCNQVRPESLVATNFLVLPQLMEIVQDADTTVPSIVAALQAKLVPLCGSGPMRQRAAWCTCARWLQTFESDAALCAFERRTFDIYKRLHPKNKAKRKRQNRPVRLPTPTRVTL